jgi:predicted enzyme related to lactoylglutathione lyase
MTNVFEQHGAFSWSELMTTDAPAAKEFYARLFGWKMRDQPIEGTVYTVLKAGEQEVGGLMEMSPEMQGMPPYWGVYVTVDDVDASAQLAEELGGQIKVPPMDIPDVGRFAVIQDPQGAVLSIITYTSPQAAG